MIKTKKQTNLLIIIFILFYFCYSIIFLISSSSIFYFFIYNKKDKGSIEKSTKTPVFFKKQTKCKNSEVYCDKTDKCLKTYETC